MKAESQFIRTIQIKDRAGRVVGTKEVVVYPGLLSKAHDEGLKSIRTSLLQIPNKENGWIAIAKAVVETAKGTFEGIGDASPESVTSFVIPHLIRMAETRAKARALRDAVNVGVISFEELDSDELPAREPVHGSGANRPAPAATNGNSHRRQGGSASNGSPLAFAPMSESQRRFLFRLLASQGLLPEQAHHHLLERFEVDSLGKVSREQASSFIDELQTRPRGNGADAGRGPALQR